MGNELSGNVLADQAGQIGGHNFHSALQVFLNGCPEFEHLQSLVTKILKASDIEVTDLLPHRVQRCLMHSFRDLSVSDSLFNIGGFKTRGGPISNDLDQLDIGLVVRDNFGHLREMPRVPLLDSHGKSVDVLVEEFQQADGLDNGLVLPVDVQGYFIPGKSMGQTQPGLL